MAFCTNCGHQLAEGAKFCYECGVKVNSSTASQGEARKIVYDGEIHKCPNCGQLLNALELRCECCGYELRGSKGSAIAQDFANGIRRLEEKGGKGVISRMATYISTFPVPNSREELLEFLVLSASNIDIRAYSFGASELSEAKKLISNAYYAKFEQVYSKAQAIFGRTPNFSDFEVIYKQKKRDISFAKRNRVLIILAIIGGGLLLMPGLPLLVIALAGGFG